MHKITKGLKKKKKGKKSKRAEDELFKPEELEKYRREHQSTSEEPAAQNEEWKKFIALTSEVDDILKKTQGDLDRIKNTSFFQKKPTETEVREAERQRAEEQQREEEARREELPPQPTGIVEVSESESEEEEDDTLFDTDYLDVIATGEVKLAYIPESPTEEQQGDDPFDTSYADRAILGPETQRKGRKLVPLGSAVEVLTGRVQLPTCATQRPTSKRQIFKEKDLLLGSFDASNLEEQETGGDTEEIQKTLLDDDSIPLPDEPIDLSKSIIPPQPVKETTPTEILDTKDLTKDILSEFESELVDNEDIEFEVLAVESLSKSAAPTPAPVPVQVVSLSFTAESSKWGAFDTEPSEPIEDDPFDTTFAENLIPTGQYENKNINSVTPNLISASTEDFLTNNIEDRISEKELNLIKPTDRDLLGGSNLDLTINGERNTEQEPTKVFDPFEITSSSVPNDDIDDDDFDPRADEKTRERTVSRPDVLNIGNTKTVSFDLPSPEGLYTESKIVKPLTPFYVRKSSVPELPTLEDDPFDTSFAVNLAPGKAELKVIESELFDPNVEKNLNLEDNNFDPRDERRAKIDEVLNSVNEIAKPKVNNLSEKIDLLAIDNDISVKVLTPGEAILEDSEELSYRDPFDTSSVTTNILPGKTELKLLESEFIYSDVTKSTGNSALAFGDKPVDDLLVQGDDVVIDKPLSPVEKFGAASFEELDDDFDPFDTSCVNDIKPGPVELKLLESEFI